MARSRSKLTLTAAGFGLKNKQQLADEVVRYKPHLVLGRCRFRKNSSDLHTQQQAKQAQNKHISHVSKSRLRRIKDVIVALWLQLAVLALLAAQLSRGGPAQQTQTVLEHCHCLRV